MKIKIFNSKILISGLLLVVIFTMLPIIKNIKNDQRTNAAISITHLSSDSGHISGGDVVTIHGSGFKKPVEIIDTAIGTGYNDDYGGASCVLLANGDIYCWGKIGTGTSSDVISHGSAYNLTPVKIAKGQIPDGVKVKQISSDDKGNFAVLAGGKIYRWSAGDSAKYQPQLVTAFADKEIIQITHAGFYVLANDNEVYQEDHLTHAVAKIIKGDIPSSNQIKNIHASFSVNNALDFCVADESETYCYDPADSTYGFKILTNTGAAVKPFKGLGHNTTGKCIIDANDQLYCNKDSDGSNPVLVNLPSGVKPTKVVSGNLDLIQGNAMTHCVLGNDHKVYCWGRNEFGALGVGLTDHYVANPTQILTGDIGAGEKIIDLFANFIAAKEYRMCVITDAQKVYCWGMKLSGIGDGTPPDNTGNGDAAQAPVFVFQNTATNTTMVKVDGQIVPATILDDNRIQVTMPPHVAGPVDIFVYNMLGDAHSLPMGYLYLDPSQPQNPSTPSSPSSAQGNSSSNKNRFGLPNAGLEKITTENPLPIIVTAIVAIGGAIVVYKKILSK